jgi:hypothetical protein
MALLWAVPPVAVAIAMVVLLAQLRHMADATDDLAIQIRRFDDVRVAVEQVRAEAARTRVTARSLRSR